jgi:hypothetical protein
MYRHRFAYLLLLCMLPGSPLGDMPQIEPLPDFFIRADMSRFVNQTGSYQKRHYFIEDQINLDYTLLRVNRTVELQIQFLVLIGMGQSLGDVVFDPMDIGYGFDPVVRLYKWAGLFELGLEHHCYHEVDRKDYRTIYYNKLFGGYQTHQFADNSFYTSLAETEHWPLLQRFALHVRWGWYLREFFGLVRPSSVSYHNNYVHQFDWHIKSALARTGPVIWAIALSGFAGYWDNYNLDAPLDTKQIYGRLTIAAQGRFGFGSNGGMVFLQWTADAMPQLPHYGSGGDPKTAPRLSRHNLWEIGLQLWR